MLLFFLTISGRKTKRMWPVRLSVFKCFLTHCANTQTTEVWKRPKELMFRIIFFSKIKKLLVFHSWMSVWLKCQAEILMLLCSFTNLRSHFKWFRFYKALCKIMFILLCVLIIYFFCTTASFFYMYVCNYLSVRYWKVHCFIYWRGWLCM